MTILNRIFLLSRYPEPSQQLRARLLYGILSILMVVIVIFTFLVPTAVTTGADTTVRRTALANLLNGQPTQFLLMVVATLAILGAIRLLQVGRLAPAGWLVVGMLANGGIVALLILEEFPLYVPAMFALATVAAGILFQRRAIIGVTLLEMAAILLSTFSRGEPLDSTLILLVLMVGAVGALTTVFVPLAQSLRIEGVTLGGAERVKLADITTQITRQASQRVTLDEALDLMLDLILKNYPQIYHAQVFLIDDDGVQARLVASTGEAGRVLLERKHSLAVGSLSVIGQTTLRGETSVAVSGRRDSIHRPNELLPDTLVEAAFPLRIGNRIIGALDLQSKVQPDFSEQDLLTFQTMADSLSLVIDNVRQFETLQRQLKENEMLAEQSRRAVRDIERLNKRLIGRAWGDYLQDREPVAGLDVDFISGSVSTAGRWSRTLAQAAQGNHVVQEGQTLAIPLKVRGQVVGALEFELEDDRDLTPEDLEMLEEVGNRFGLAAENTRLVDESQRVAQRESLINEIASRLQGTYSVEATLNQAARSLHDALKAERVRIRLNTPQTANGAPNGNGAHPQDQDGKDRA